MLAYIPTPWILWLYIYITSDFSKQPEILDNIQYYEIYTLKYDATIAQFV